MKVVQRIKATVRSTHKNPPQKLNMGRNSPAFTINCIQDCVICQLLIRQTKILNCANRGNGTTHLFFSKSTLYTQTFLHALI